MTTENDFNDLLNRVARYCELHDMAERGEAPTPSLCLLDWHRWTYKLSSVESVTDEPPGHAVCERCGVARENEPSTETETER